VEHAGFDGQVAPARQHVADLDLAGPAEDDAERAVAGMIEDEHHGAGERGVGQPRHRHEQRPRADVVEAADGQRRDRGGASTTGRGPRGRAGLGIG
jgi:hypothetical protein